MGDARVKHIADISIHPLYRTGSMKQETFHTLLEVAKTIYGKIYTDGVVSSGFRIRPYTYIYIYMYIYI